MSHTEQRAEDVSIKGGPVTVGELSVIGPGAPSVPALLTAKIKANETRDGFVDEVAEVVIVTNLGTPELRINPFARSSASNVWPASSRRAERAMRAPSFAKARTVARPMLVRAGDQNHGVLIVNS